MNAIICLVENDYWNGFTAIINSAIRNKFTGNIFLGYRGEIPVWINKFEKTNAEDKFIINTNIKLTLIEIQSERHLGYEKVFFMSDIIENNEVERILYFDIDCVAVANFEFFNQWCYQHLALCMDECYTYIHPNHPWKLYWLKKLKEFQYPIHHLAHPYVNSGFIGISKINFDFIETCKTLTLRLELEGLDTSTFNKSALIPIQGDQEILNMALIATEIAKVSIIGTEGMGFTEPSYLMVHCTKPEKPWSKNFLLTFLKNGYSISNKEKKYVDYLLSPYNNLGKRKTLIIKIDIFLTKLISRIF